MFGSLAERAVSASANASTALLPLIDPTTLSPAGQLALQTIPFKRNILSTLAWATGLFIPLMGILGGCFDGHVRILPGQDWQLVVLRVAHVLDAPYVYDNNQYAAQIIGMPLIKIKSFNMSSSDIVAGKGPWTHRDRLILNVIDEQLATNTNEVKTIESALTVLSYGELVEALIIMGTYRIFAGVAKGLRVDEDSTAPGLETVIRQIVTTNFLDEIKLNITISEPSGPNS